MPDPDVTPVIFRVWPEGDVIAIFPELAYSRDGHLCMSYQHVGQHGGADCELVTKATRHLKLRKSIRGAEWDQSESASPPLLVTTS